MEAELRRRPGTFEMIAGANFAPRFGMQAHRSVLTDKCAEGHLGRQYYGSCEHRCHLISDGPSDRVWRPGYRQKSKFRSSKATTGCRTAADASTIISSSRALFKHSKRRA
ncbi:hypothetical protein GT354_32040 [Streptomyces sp. SID3343]|nr:hypothetical protein [Streptomyces sp. SID3343]